MSQPSSSNRSSLEPSSNPSSPSPSPAGTPLDPPRKRTRASKPKQVMKCDEGKPACLRCTSTGRTCDGYDKAALARYRSPDPNQTAERARAEFVRACEWNETLRSMRRIEADIDGTETEKRLFARFRAATADGVAANLCNFAAFWRRLNPSTGCQDDAVKHAVVALAAAYQLFQHPDEPVIDGFARGDLEVFTIQQYSRSIERLQNHAGSSSPESLRLTLVCCLAFISLETLRGNHEVAVTHLTNGLRILQSLPDSTFDCLADGSMFAWPSSRDSLHMSDIVQLFARFELSACFFTHGIQPVISGRGYLTRRFDDGSTYNLFHDVPHAHMAMSCFQHDVVARLHEITAAAASGDETSAIFWSDPAQQRTQACLLARSARLGALIVDFFSPLRFGMPDPTSPELASLYLTLLHFRSAQFLIAKTAGGIFTPTLDPFLQPFHHHHNHHNHNQTTPYPQPHPQPQSQATNPDPTLLPTILHLASRLSQTTPTTPSPPPTPTDVHTHLLGPLYLVATHTPDPDTRAAAGALLADALQRGGLAGAEVGEGRGRGRGRGREVDLGVGVGLGLVAVERAQRVLSAVGRVVARERERGGMMGDGSGGGGIGGGGIGGVIGGGGLLSSSVDVPRALAGAGGIPALWDGLVAAGAGAGAASL
ncbi:uncharacterized protein B0H64DRAFT_445176 [Chaetomium fimeti]|uniref:Zn(2)-C6 fungal-type domain-containing protein n=1 Tax=Chaetomium fimeti TaxID=1854472 RepID=A0AAE0H938_9PEZI|nr:hypothetical protein B0H64DRAFT_445176 [Chaetomium fimeti]